MNTQSMTTALMLCTACASPPTTQLRRNCGDTAYGASMREDIVLLFSSSQYAAFRKAHQIQTLPAGTQARLLTKARDCRPSVDTLIAHMNRDMPDVSEMKNGPVDHTVFEVGPYEAILFADGEIEEIGAGFVGAAVFDKQTHVLIAQTAY